MPCPICDEKPINCQCTEAERRMYCEMEELEEQVPRWISVGERLPDENMEVLAWNGGGQCLKPWQGHVLCEYRNGEWRESQESDLYPGITHWMPLPEPPEQP